MVLKNDDLAMREIARKLKNFKGNVSLLDIGSDEEHLRELLPKNVVYKSLDYKGEHDYVRNLDDLPLKINEKFDVVVALEVLEHTINPHAVMEEILKLSKPDTVFFLSMPNEYNFYCRLNFLLGKKTSVQEPFQVVNKHLHIHQPRVKDVLKFFSQYVKIQKVHYCWYSRTSEHGKGIKKNLSRGLDKVFNLFSKFWPSMFTRSVMVVGVRKNG